MATISSHVLDSVSGDHAGGIRIECYRLVGESGREKVFDVIANHEGRIAETVDMTDTEHETQYELVFHSADYFDAQPAAPATKQIMRAIVVRIDIPTPDEKIHIPVMLSPHAYSTWWSA